ncbi:cupin domain-containing protein [Ferrimonas balearica]|uniref:ribosomal protein uL16 3-hydroxylase n=1 Tax=Ferrimonas balearica TaxID=44012 RepID=UPI001F1BCCA1|nr:cupin domain-containing protein [Ferrimonas balearica]MBY6095022.1 cupin domain-containing protein [Ferrimonas balearica]
MKLNLEISTFLSHYWQQRPALFKAALPDFVDPLSPDELAGLALEEDVSSRIIVRDGAQWRSEPGGREDYSELGEANWQLLVQAVNHHDPDAQALCHAFRFLPDWRFDDLMISFATPGGGVGPHIDNYDVFIIQGEGERRWQVGPKGNYAARPNSGGMALVEDFEPIIDAVMSPGDVLYIPPGYPHCGQTLTPSLSYSLGYRAPSQAELLSAVADTAVDLGLGQPRFTSREEHQNPAVVSQQQQHQMLTMVQGLLEHPMLWQHTLGGLLSQNRFELAPCPPHPPLQAEEVDAALADGAELVRLEGLKVLQLEGDNTLTLYLDGDDYSLSEGLESTAQRLSQAPSLSTADWAPLWRAQPDVLLAWLNLGYWRFE